MALFNAFLNTKGSGGQEYPTFAWPGNQASGGASFYQTTIGLDYSGPQIFCGGKVHGSVYMDFAGGSGTPLDLGFRLRTGRDRNRLGEPKHHGRPGKSHLRAARACFAGASGVRAPDRRGQSVALDSAGALRAEDPFHGPNRRTRAIRRGADQRIFSPTSRAAGRAAPEPARPGLEGRFEFYHRFQGNSQDGAAASKSRPDSTPALRTWRAHPSRPICSRSIGSPIRWRSWNSPAHFSAGKTWLRWAVSKVTRSCPRASPSPYIARADGAN